MFKFLSVAVLLLLLTVEIMSSLLGFNYLPGKLKNLKFNLDSSLEKTISQEQSAHIKTLAAPIASRKYYSHPELLGLYCVLTVDMKTKNEIRVVALDYNNKSIMTKLPEDILRGTAKGFTFNRFTADDMYRYEFQYSAEVGTDFFVKYIWSHVKNNLLAATKLDSVVAYQSIRGTEGTGTEDDKNEYSHVLIYMQKSK